MIQTSRFDGEPKVRSSRQTLLDTTVSAADAQDLVRGQLDAAIQFQKLQNLRAQVHTEASDPEALRTIEHLEATRARLFEALSRARSSGARVSLKTTIELSIDEFEFSR